MRQIWEVICTKQWFAMSGVCKDLTDLNPYNIWDEFEHRLIVNHPTIRPHSYSLSAMEQISASTFQLVKNIIREVKRYQIMRSPPILTIPKLCITVPCWCHGISCQGSCGNHSATSKTLLWFCLSQWLMGGHTHTPTASSCLNSAFV